jgi:phosphoribosylformimino-5-aminoimidazole carboxamide ribotide isomerase
VGHPLYASGGIATVEDLHALRAAGAAGAVIGMALYTGTLDPRQAALEFGGAVRPTT